MALSERINVMWKTIPSMFRAQHNRARFTRKKAQFSDSNYKTFSTDA